MKIYDINNKKDFNFSAIYLWTNLVNGKVYVGQTQNFYNRMKQYQRGNDDNRIIGVALKKYGFDNFDIKILEKDIPLNKLDEYEQYWMDYYNSYDLNIGYNLCREASTTRGFRHSKESKIKMSESAKRFYEEHPEKIKRGKDSPVFGSTMSEENRRKMSQRLVGNQYAKGKHWNLSDETKEKHRQSMLGKQNCLGRKLSQETKDKISCANKGNVCTEETKRKISEANKGRTARKVLCIETGFVYDSITQASLDVGRDGSSISKCCRGKQNTVAGYHWEYLD